MARREGHRNEENTMSNPDLAARKRLTKRTSALQRQETLIGYAFILPALIVFLVFVAFQIGRAHV